VHFSLDTRIVTLGVGEMSTFVLGPRGGGGGAGGLWRAQLGQHWHTEFRNRAAEEPGARFEVPIEGASIWRGWTFQLGGRIDQFLPSPAGGVVLRELKTVTRPLPAAESELQAAYPEYFVQLAAYLVLHAATPGAAPARGELVFIEASSGFVQTVAAPAEPAAVLRGQLDGIIAFLEQRRRARDRRRAMVVRPAFHELRSGQEHVQRDLRAALGLGGAQISLEGPPPGGPVKEEDGRHGGRPSNAAAGFSYARPTSSVLLFEAPTGFGKTGCLLEFALTALKEGVYDRLVYLTGKSTGQLQVVRQLETMLAPASGEPAAAARLPYWQVRSKAEHCINLVYHCLPDVCPFLDGAEERWPQSGLARIYLLDGEARDLESLRAAGRAAQICPYEITRAALPFNDVWVGDYNYVFSPANRGVFLAQPGFDAAATLLIVDEAHNLPARVADACSHSLRVVDAWTTYDALRQARAPAAFVMQWDAWARELAGLPRCDELDPSREIRLRAAAHRLAEIVPQTALDFVSLGPRVAELLWQLPSLDEFLDAADLPKLLWCPAPGELRVTCLDAAAVIGDTLRSFRHAILTSATLSPVDALATACGLDRPRADAPGKPPAPDLAAALGRVSRKTQKALRGLTTAAALLRVEEERTAETPQLLHAGAPWRVGAYRVAIDARVDTSYKRRAQHYELTAETVEQVCAAAQRPSNPSALSEPSGRIDHSPSVVFFPSYAYAETIAKLCGERGKVRGAVQPRGLDLAAQAAFIEAALLAHDALFFVLGTGFTEGIDLLGGRVTHALVVGPALPEVNAVQRARLAHCASVGREAAFRLVYQVPGMQKVNQALGRLVRAPGHRATVLLHCRRFAEKSYRELLDPELAAAPGLDTDETLAAWLAGREITG